METLKKWGSYVLTPFIVTAAAIYFLLTRNRTLKDQLNQEKASRELGATLGKLEDQKKEADSAEAEFDRKLADLKRALDEHEPR